VFRSNSSGNTAPSLMPESPPCSVLCSFAAAAPLIVLERPPSIIGTIAPVDANRVLLVIVVLARESSVHCIKIILPPETPPSVW
jgi:hypothetical protein